MNLHNAREKLLSTSIQFLKALEHGKYCTQMNQGPVKENVPELILQQKCIKARGKQNKRKW